MNDSSRSDAKRSAALVLAILLAAFAALHAYWALGGSWGLQTALGPTTPRPASGPIWAMAVVQGMFAYAALAVARAPAEPPFAPRIALWGLALGAALVGCLNIVMGTRPAERLGIGPFSTLIALLAVYSALRTRSAPVA